MSKQTKKLQAEWEAKLRKLGLGVTQPLTDHSEGEMADLSFTQTDEFDQLRKKRRIDGSDQFMTGHQITKIRRMEREVPEWAMSDEKVQQLLLTSFPKMKETTAQRKRAGRWYRIIYLYYRLGLPKQIVARELKISGVQLTRFIQSISRAAEGKNVNGVVRTLHTRHLSGALMKPLPPREADRKDETSEGTLLPEAGANSEGQG